MHTMPANQTENFVQNVDTPLYIFTPVTPVTIQIPTNENVQTTVIEIPLHNDMADDVSRFTEIS